MRQASFLKSVGKVTLLSFLTIVATTMLGHASFAAAPNSTHTSVTRLPEGSIPTRTEIQQALTRVESLPNYAKYITLSPDTLSVVTPHSREYQYLFSLVTTGYAMLDQYDTVSPDNLRMIVEAANDAVRACNLIFAAGQKAESNLPLSGSTNSPAATTQSSQSAQPSQPHPSIQSTVTTPSTTSASSSESSNLVVANNGTSNSSIDDSTTHETSDPNPNSDIVNTDSTTESTLTDLGTATNESTTNDIASDSTINTSSLLTHATTTCVVCAAAGTIIYKSRNSYRPGRR